MRTRRVLALPALAGLTAMCLEAAPFPYVDFSRPRNAGEPNATLEVAVVVQGTRVRVAVDNRLAAAVPPAAAQTLAAEFDRRIYATNTGHFGPLPEPLAAAPVTVIVHGGFPAGVEGYQLDRNLDGNRLAAVYLDAAVVQRSPRRAAAVLAREFQRVLAAARVQRGFPPEPAWIQESLALYAEYLNGYDHNRAALDAFRAEPGAAILTASPTSSAAARGAAYSFFVYVTEQAAPKADRRAFLAATVATGFAQYVEDRYAELLRGWALANAAGGRPRAAETAAGMARYRYADLDLAVAADRHFAARGRPIEGRVAVPRGAARFVRLEPDWALRDASELTVAIGGLAAGQAEAYAVREWSNGAVEVEPVTSGEVRTGAFGMRDAALVTLVFVNVGQDPAAPARELTYTANIAVGKCLDVSGRWQSSERGTLTCTATAMGETETDSEPIRGSAEVTILQSGCSIEYTPPDPFGGSLVRALMRRGVVEGTRVSVSGASVVAISDDVRLTENSFEAAGLASAASMALTGSGKFAGSASFEGIPVQFACTTETTAQFNRLDAAAPQVPAISAASHWEGTLSPDSAGALIGTFDIPPGAAEAGAPLPDTLQGVSLTMTDSGGAEHTVRLYSVAPRRVTFHVPAEVAAGPALLTLRRLNSTAARASVHVSLVAPGLFTVNDQMRGTPLGIVVRVAADGTRSEQPLAACTGTSCEAPAIDLGVADQVYVTLLATGLRGASEFRLSAGEAVLEGTWEPDARPGYDRLTFGPLPRSLAGAGVVPATVTAGGIISNLVVLEFR